MVEAAIKREISKLCGVDVSTIGGGSRLAEYGLDSVKMIEICCSIEERYDIEIEDDEIMPIATVSELIELIEEKI